jgi:hypothetical protein
MGNSNEVGNESGHAQLIGYFTFDVRRFYRPEIDFRRYSITKITNNL